jgi:hypothetical protein
MEELAPNSTLRAGRSAVLAVIAVMLITTVATTHLTAMPIGIDIIRLIITVVLLSFLYRGDRWARILLVVVCALTVFIILRLAWRGYWTPLSLVRVALYLGVIYVLVWFRPANEFYRLRANS